jgi:glycosyltransferase involved in cell wall biosynthesis
VQRFRDHHKLGSDFTLLYLGRLDPKKGLESLFEALASVKAEVPAWRLLIAGSGDAAYTAALKAMPSRMGIADRVLFLGEVKGKEKSVAFRAADVFVLPSLHENFAVAAAEALSSGLPVIVSKAVGISPYVAERHCGVVTDGTSTSLGAAIVKLSHDAALRREMSENGRRLAAEVFNWRSIARELMRVYFEFAANNVAHTPAACAD